jgi:hypothetical protein
MRPVNAGVHGGPSGVVTIKKASKGMLVAGIT